LKRCETQLNPFVMVTVCTYQPLAGNVDSSPSYTTVFPIFFVLLLCGLCTGRYLVRVLSSIQQVRWHIGR